MNLKPIKKGATYSFTLKMWEDSAKTQPVDLSTYSFTFLAVNTAGATVISLANSDFIEVSDFERRITIADNVTNGYPIGELYYQVDATLPDTTKEELFDGYIQILA